MSKEHPEMNDTPVPLEDSIVPVSQNDWDANLSSAPKNSLTRRDVFAQRSI